MILMIFTHGWHIVGTLIEALIDDPDICLVLFWHIFLDIYIYTSVMRSCCMVLMNIVDVHMAHDVHS
jgi:hypothetical protein